MSRNIALIAGTAVIAGILGSYAAVYFWTPANAIEACSGSQIAGSSIGGPFTLVDETGATVTDADVITGPTLIYFGYTFCPDVCPLDNARNAQAVDLLDERGIAATPVFITVDPARDTVDVVASYTDNFHDRMLGLTGSEEQIAAVSRTYKTYYRKADDDPEYYLVDHSTFSYLAFPGLGVVDFFKREDTPEAIADRVGCYVDAIG